MGKQKRHTAEQIIAKLREADVELGVSERRACRVLRQHRSTQRRARLVPDGNSSFGDSTPMEVSRQRLAA